MTVSQAEIISLSSDNVYIVNKKYSHERIIISTLQEYISFSSALEAMNFVDLLLTAIFAYSEPEEKEKENA